ncbi:uncharacterized protein PHACADRAFT_259811 [Phanerochaete carnosa HHB-10118-sp]|uniref:Protein prenyltransferase alpha subunit repeat-containing protein 1 n=1 Tax=Phanerochaete carnosa (strain HHB-10118-sp) TaxID=650164 RepID=K5W3D4_PHACS|nr:uncharacterized protein PHACADRAFT_259811 [Phanerochaete carnosa HHB-10118-sp]EKM53429.1 hypothetical protein PHACADRAFT_259811 [Phanerochaete carnosa HHB-10118-sp]
MEGNLGIPQKSLYKAYLEAAPAFNQARLLLRSIPHSIDVNLAATIVRTTAVLLVANPGHHSAWNARKRTAESGHLDLERELLFTRALLTVRECAKHSLLWHHRRWLLQHLCRRRAVSSNIPSNSRESIRDEDSLRHLAISPSQLRAEFDACTLAATTYERNYFAWTHRAQCLDALMSLLQGEKDCGYLDLPLEEMVNVSLWIDRHVSDYTAMQYHCRLVLLIRAAEMPPPTTLQSVYTHAKSLVEAFPEHESLWCYLRSAARVEDVSESEIRLVAEMLLQTQVEADPASQASLRHAKGCLDWLGRHS